ncbi:MAG: type II toxin-antitoxin system PemK/MazF family toxin [Spirochaetales bacterium]|nr:type II toxin-antitoxin system PemK/MazF family toxin [Spirochaetales bacterium]
MIIKRYEVYYANLSPSIGSEIQKIRPVVVVSKTEMNKYLDTVVICPATTKLHTQWRSRIQCVIDTKDAEIAVDQIRTISKKRIKNKIDTISSEINAQLRALITEMYGE